MVIARGYSEESDQYQIKCMVFWDFMWEIVHRKSYRECVNSGLDYWTGLLDWTTGLIFDLKFILSAQKGKIVKEKHSVTVCVGRRESGED